MFSFNHLHNFCHLALLISLKFRKNKLPFQQQPKKMLRRFRAGGQSEQDGRGGGRIREGPGEDQRRRKLNSVSVGS